MNSWKMKRSTEKQITWQTRLKTKQGFSECFIMDSIPYWLGSNSVGKSTSRSAMSNSAYIVLDHRTCFR